MKSFGELHPAALRLHGRVRLRCFLAGVVAICLLATDALLHAQVLRDNFADRQLLTAPSGSLDGNNTSATLEPGEPRHGGKTGGHSLWISWVAPSNGVVKFETMGSSFDTLLSAYYFASSNSTALSQLVELARADDSEGLDDESEIKFGVLEGCRYEIAVDGYFGAAGPLELDWEFAPTIRPPPVILSSSGDRAVNAGESVTLTVVLTNLANGTYRWYHNTEELDEFSPTLVIPNVQAADVGRYRLRVSIEGPDYYSVPAEIQINSDGVANALAQNKLFDALGSPLTPDGGGGGLLHAASAGVSRGYNGSQIFNTTYSTPDPLEPLHCGLSGGATFWCAYQPPADGTLILDTQGSTYDTFIAVYTFDPPLTGYAGLIPINCDDNGAGTNGAARLEFAAPRSRQFLVVVDGINGARGIVHLNYRLDTNRPPVPPTLMAAPAPRTIASGMDVALRPEVTGSAPLRFHWRMGASALAGQTNALLQLTNVAPLHAGNYFVSVSSHVGAPLEVLLPLKVLLAPQLQLSANPNGASFLTFPGVPGQRYVVEYTGSLDQPWLSLSNIFAGEGLPVAITNAAGEAARFYRVRVE